MFPSTSHNHFPCFIINHDPLMLTATPTFSSFETVHMSNKDIMNHKKPSLVKKERHSKIRTAQGLRDRRVRLSIDIAREFFDLQDTLGFDKASKTLEWLLTKSKSSILELARSGTTARNNHEDHGTTAEESNNGSTLCPKTNNKLNNLSKVVSREKARERARLRTRAKMYVQSSIAQMQEIHNVRPYTTTRVLPVAEIVTEESLNFGNYHLTSTTAKDVTSSISTSSNNYIPNLPQIWDSGGALTRSSFYAKINRDLSTGTI